MPANLNRFITLPRTLLRGVGQIYFQRSSWAGMACIAALGVQSESMALGAILGVLVGTAIGFLLGDTTALEDGLHGYNGALAGLGVMLILEPGMLAWGTAAAASAAATVLAHYWRARLSIPPYTAPFVLVVWLVMAIVALSGVQTIDATAPPAAARALIFLPDGAVRGIGQVIFADQPIAGLLCLGGLAIASLRVAAYALTAAALAIMVAWTLGFPPELAAWGLFSFNAVLTVEALRTREGATRWWLLVLGVVISVVVTRGFQYASLPSLTAPFLITTWMLRAAFSSDRDESNVVACSRVA